MTTKSGYKVSFTSGGLHYREAIKTTELYDCLGDWKRVRLEILTDNLFQSRTRATANRILGELLPRLQTLTGTQLRILIDGSHQEQNQILWLAICKQYPFVQAFAIEVLREKYLRMDLELSRLDYDAFFNRKAEWYPEINVLKPSTKKRMRQMLFHVLREADLVSPTNQILTTILSPRVTGAITADHADLLAIFPIHSIHIEKQGIYDR